MTQFQVQWTIDIEAETPRDAASMALTIMKRRGSTATVFEVTESERLNGQDLGLVRTSETIDLDEPELVAARDLRLGDVLDLEGDEFADKREAPDAPSLFEFESAQVIEPSEYEGSACIVIHTDKVSFGCPPDHKVKRLRTDFDLKRELEAD